MEMYTGRMAVKTIISDFFDLVDTKENKDAMDELTTDELLTTCGLMVSDDMWKEIYSAVKTSPKLMDVLNDIQENELTDEATIKLADDHSLVDTYILPKLEPVMTELIHDIHDEFGVNIQFEINHQSKDGISYEIPADLLYDGDISVPFIVSMIDKYNQRKGGFTAHVYTTSSPIAQKFMKTIATATAEQVRHNMVGTTYVPEGVLVDPVGDADLFYYYAFRITSETFSSTALDYGLTDYGYPGQTLAQIIPTDPSLTQSDQFNTEYSSDASKFIETRSNESGGNDAWVHARYITSWTISEDYVVSVTYSVNVVFTLPS